MKIKHVIVLALTLFTSCLGQNSKKQNKERTKKQTEMTIEKFDIETFEKNKIDDEYNFTLENGAEVRQLSSENDYREILTPSLPELLVTSKQYFKSGELQTISVFYPKYFISNIKKYSKEGELIENVDYDKNYKLKIEDILIILEKELGKNTVKIPDRLTSISRSSKEEAYWYIEYYDYQQKGYDKRIDEFNPNVDLALIIIEELTIDDSTGKIIAQGYHAHNDN